MKKVLAAALIVLFMVGANDFIETNYDDDVSITFGTATAFKQKYDSGDTRLEWLDGADNVLVHLTDGGTTGTITVTGGLALPNGAITASTYTPTLTGVANVSASTARVCQYIRVGNTVTVSGGANITQTSGSTYTRIGISLPVASNFANAYECGGAGGIVISTSVAQMGQILGDATNNRAEFDYISDSSGATAREFTFHFTYQII